MLITHGDAHDFVNKYDGRYDNIGVGVDESNVPPAELELIFKNGGQKNFSYADGITTFLAKPGVYENITKAQACHDQNAPRSFNFIYTWVLSHEASMRRYLDTYIDGIMVDPPAVEDLRKLVTSAPYDKVYRLATNGDNPFKRSPAPRYRLEINTSKKFLSGTDATLLFTLTGTDKRLIQSLPFNGKEWGALERGSVTNVWLEGQDVGEIESLTISPLTDGIGSAWLPESVTVESKLLDAPVTFNFNQSDEDWISKKGGPVVKYPA
jgi:hypothetical protein